MGGGGPSFLFGAAAIELFAAIMICLGRHGGRYLLFLLWGEKNDKHADVEIKRWPGRGWQELYNIYIYIYII